MSEVMISKGHYTIVSWKEEQITPEGEMPMRRVAKVEKSFAGALEGSSTLTYHMVYHPNGTADFTGEEAFVGSLDGREGSLVLFHRGTFSAGVAEAECEVVAGGGNLSGVRGTLSFRNTHGEEAFAYMLSWRER